jgi:hypothetical protein
MNCSDIYITAGAFDNFLRTVRYLGGAENTGDVGAFTARFLDGCTISRVTELGGGSVAGGFEAIRNTLTSSFPTLAGALRRMGETGFGDPGADTFQGNNEVYAAGLNNYNAFLLQDFFGQRGVDTTEFNDLGINDSGSFDGVAADMNAVYNPSSVGSPTSAADALREKLKNTLQTKVSFGICPHVALKVSSFFDEMKACLYVKAGAIRLSGRTVPKNDIPGFGKEKFNRITPFLAVGVEKNIGNGWGFAAEFSHAFKTTQRLKDITLLPGSRTENRVSVGRTCVRIMAVYRFR